MQSPEPQFLPPAELLEEDVPVSPRGRSLWPLAVVVLITGLALAIAVAATTASSRSTQNAASMTSSEPSAPIPIASAPPPVADPGAVTTLGAAPPAATTLSRSADATTGTVELPAWTKGHRIYVDDHVAGEGPEPLRVRCGPHTIRLGSAGRELSAVVPCGGVVRVGR
jgi:hypothetical protein